MCNITVCHAQACEFQISLATEFPVNTFTSNQTFVYKFLHLLYSVALYITLFMHILYFKNS